MWRYLLADLHVHTVLSACAEVEMIPPLIVQRALALGLAMIGIADHNSVRNAGAVLEAACGTGLTVLPGMELSSREEVHLVCLFDSLCQAEAWDRIVASALPPLANDEHRFGAQYVVDATGQHVETEERLLSVATALSIEEAVTGVRACGGMVVAAHVDRPSFSLIGNLGLVPAGLEIAGLELSRQAKPEQVVRQMPQVAGFGYLVGGDAHRLEEMTARTMFKVRGATVAELCLALASRHGRRVEIA